MSAGLSTHLLMLFHLAGPRGSLHPVFPTGCHYHRDVHPFWPRGPHALHRRSILVSLLWLLLLALLIVFFAALDWGLVDPDLLIVPPTALDRGLVAAGIQALFFLLVPLPATMS